MAYVYCFFRPNGSPCYIGKGTRSDRLNDHFRGKNSNRHLQFILKQAGGSLPYVVLKNDMDEEESLNMEIALIAAIGRVANGGPLVNLTDGGEGVSGYKPTKETIQRQKVSLQETYETNPTLRKLVSERTKAAMASPEVKLNTSLAQKKRAENPEEKARLQKMGAEQAALKFGCGRSDEDRKRMSDGTQLSRLNQAIDRWIWLTESITLTSAA